MRIAIIGAGGSGLATAWLVGGAHDVDIYESEAEPGGHARTVFVRRAGALIPVETGFRYFFEAPYPHLTALLSLLDVDVWERATQLTLTRPNAGPHTVSLPPGTLRQVAGLLRRPTLIRQLMGLRRFMTRHNATVEQRDWSLTFGEFLDANGYADIVARGLLIPFVAASWGAPLSDMPHFPAYSVLKVMQLTEGKTSFVEIDGGISRYVQAIVDGLVGCRLHLGHPVRAVEQHPEGGLRVVPVEGESRRYDRVVFATPSHVAADLLADSAGLEAWHERLSPFRHFDADIAIHGDPAFMPRDRRDWGDLNHFHTPDHVWMTEWLGRDAGVDVFRTWMPPGADVPSPLFHRVAFRHLIMDRDTPRRHRVIAEAQGEQGIYAVGMYVTDVDNHESALDSALQVGRLIAPDSSRVAQWTAAVETTARPRHIPRRAPTEPVPAAARVIDAGD